MSYLWTDGAPQEAPASRTTVYQEVLQAIGSGLATPFTVHCKVPRLESEVRARRVLDAMATAGLLDCSIRPGRALYRKADPMPPAKKSESNDAAKRKPRHSAPVTEVKSMLSLAILAVLRKRPWLQSPQIAAVLNAENNEVQSKLYKFRCQNRIIRRGKPFHYEYAVNEGAENA